METLTLIDFKLFFVQMILAADHKTVWLSDVCAGLHGVAGILACKVWLLLTAPCASLLQESGELVQVLSVPNSCLPGDSVHRDGSKPPAEFPKECKSKVWKEIVDGLAVQGGVATYLGAPLVTSSGRISVASDMPDGSSIH
jgi:hypothetical protein